jgi:N-acetylglutamate synthase-like GNAT family acetyltransferase
MRTPELITIRPALGTDFDRVKRLVRSELVNPWGLKEERFLIAEDPAGNLLGCVQIKQHSGGSKELASLVVSPAWRGRGVARSLVDAVVDRSASPLWLTCRSRLIPFYERFGFREVHDRTQMPLYFKLVPVFEMLLRIVGRMEGYIAVMYLSGPEESTARV